MKRALYLLFFLAVVGCYAWEPKNNSVMICEKQFKVWDVHTCTESGYCSVSLYNDSHEFVGTGRMYLPVIGESAYGNCLIYLNANAIPVKKHNWYRFDKHSRRLVVTDFVEKHR